MSIFANSRFKKRFPGPYDIRLSSDGVDGTFEIVCLSTDNCIAATRYWDPRDDQRAAYVAAYAIAAALNDMFHDLTLAQHCSLLSEFYAYYPGPYRLSHGRGGLGSYHTIDCDGSGISVITCYGGRFDFDTLSIIHTFNEALSLQRMYFPFSANHRQDAVHVAESELIPF